MIFLLDNYDSFTWNLAQSFGAMGAEPVVVRNNHATTESVIASRPRAIVISPGPGRPTEAGISIQLILAAAAARIPLLGVCLGHQAIGEAFGGRVVRAERQMHGKTTLVETSDPELFAGLERPFEVMRYHSLVVSPQEFPAELEATAWSTDVSRGAEIMALRHRAQPIWGVQFHPESVGTPAGKRILTNFVNLANRAM